MIRRDFTLILLIVFSISGCSSVIKRRTDKLSIIQGITSVREVEFNILSLAKANLTFELRSAEGEIIAPEEIKKITRQGSNWATHKIIFLREQKNDYNLFVYQDGKLVDQRLIGKGQKTQSTLKLAVVSCANGYYSDHLKIWDTIAEKNPEYLLMIGDNLYADISQSGVKLKVTPDLLWEKYVDQRLSLPIFFQQKLIPIHALWDDHDYGMNDGNETYEYKKESAQIFDAFFAQSLNDENYTKGKGIGGLLSMGDFNLFFLDGRSFRSPESTGLHLGKEQQGWLMKTLAEESQPSLLIKGDQFFGGYHRFESYEGNHPKDFENFILDLRKMKMPFIFFSGDRHLSEIMQFPRSLFGLPSFEITSSPVHSKLFPDSSEKNPWRVVHNDSAMNFMLIQNVAEDNHWFLDVENIGENGEVFFKRELAVFIKDLQNNLQEARKRRTGKRRYQKIRGRRR